MPFILSQIAPGSTCRPLTRLTPHLSSFPRPSATHWRAYTSGDFSPCPPILPSAGKRTLCLQTRPAPLFHHPEFWLPSSRPYSTHASASEPVPQGLEDASSTNAACDENKRKREPIEEQLEETVEEQLDHPFRPQRSRRTRKRQRSSRPALLLEILSTSAKSLYAITPPGKVDLSYTHPGRGRKRARSMKNVILAPEPVSLYSILGRYLRHYATVDQAEGFRVFKGEQDLLQSKGFTSSSVGRWASCLMESKSTVAAKIFEPGGELPPFFLLLTFLRRRHIRVSAFDIIMRHIKERLRLESLCWSVLKVLLIRLLRHARELRPEWIPWVASIYVTEAARFYETNETTPFSLRFSVDVTRYTNTLLSLLSLPTNNQPMLSSIHQENAQAQILQFMASCSPAVVVTRLGFRSVTRTQLARAKTVQEREWADLKGPSWPPWKESRTAMDEEKGYEFGTSRASKILHRMCEAGYRLRTAEEMMEIYAGWDTDSSPTIQTRTNLPHISSQYGDNKLLRPLVWASRIRTTRSRREAWACFLAYESTGVPANSHVYLAMFEKLHYQVVEGPLTRHDYQLSLEGKFEPLKSEFSPGDMKEVFPDPSSPLHYVHLSEPIPTYSDLYHRMKKVLIPPSNRLLVFLLETHPDFSMVFDLLDQPKSSLHPSFRLLLAGTHDDQKLMGKIPWSLFTAFIRFLCRFGHFEPHQFRKLDSLSPELHAYRLRNQRGYLVEYAHFLLMHYKPKYRPAWSAYVNKLVQRRETGIAENILRNEIVCAVMETMDEVDLDIDDDFFRVHCTVTYHLAQAAYKHSASVQDSRSVLSNASLRLRKSFHMLVGTNAIIHQPAETQESQESPNIIPAYAPAPAALHAYVRALGILRDYEGLYSFSTWLTQHHVEVSARASGNHGGSNLVFRTLVALRAAVEGRLAELGQPAPADIAQLIELQVQAVEDWGGWPTQEDVYKYINGSLKSTRGVR